MLNKISDRFYKWTKGWLVLVLLVLDGFFAGFLLPLIQGTMQDGKGGVTPLDLMMFSTPAEIFAMIARYDIVFYRLVELTVDILYPIVYLFFFGLLISWLFQRGYASNSPMRKLNVLPVGAWFFDLLENITIVILLSMYPGSQPTGLAWVLIILTHIKWLFAGATILLILIGLVMAVRNKFKVQQ